jgi:hypothetical protein
MEPIVIRPFRAPDLPALVRLDREIAASTGVNELGTVFLLACSYLPDPCSLVALRGDALIGFVACVTRQRTVVTAFIRCLPGPEHQGILAELLLALVSRREGDAERPRLVLVSGASR